MTLAIEPSDNTASGPDLRRWGSSDNFGGCDRRSRERAAQSVFGLLIPIAGSVPKVVPVAGGEATGTDAVERLLRRRTTRALLV